MSYPALALDPSGGPSGGPGAAEDPWADVVDVVCRRFTEDAGFTADLDAWVDDKCTAFAAAGGAVSPASSSSPSPSPSSERSLVQTVLHDEFKRMYEAKVEGLIAAHGTTVA